MVKTYNMKGTKSEEQNNFFSTENTKLIGLGIILFAMLMVLYGIVWNCHQSTAFVEDLMKILFGALIGGLAANAKK